MQILFDEPLKNYTSYKIGGNTPKLYIVETIVELEKIPDKDLRDSYILGNGTNIMVSDKGVDKPVVKINFKQFILDEITNVLTVGAGVNLSEAAKTLAEKGYEGLVHVAGIPGSIGGSIIMNASASQGTISDFLIDVEVFNKETKQRKVFSKSECKFEFRSSIFQDSPWIITFIRFKLRKADKDELIETYEKIINYRKKNYPLSFPSAGCWFKKAWGGKDIIQKIGMVGAIKGKAVVSPMFPAFILNTGDATAEDISLLVREIQDKAKSINEELLLEIFIWGEI